MEISGQHRELDGGFWSAIRAAGLILGIGVHPGLVFGLWFRVSGSGFRV